MSLSAPLWQCLRCTRRAFDIPYARAFSSTTAQQNQRPPVVRRRRRDPYAQAQAKARKAANLSKQRLLQQTRADSLGDPIRGIETPFVASFDKPPVEQKRNFFVSDDTLKNAIARSSRLNTPTEEEIARMKNGLSAKEAADLDSKIQAADVRAKEAMERITRLDLGSSKDRLRINIQRCIDTFGRHKTDASLPPKITAPIGTPIGQVNDKRLGADTGSSEVQIAILTAKIRALDANIGATGLQDKHNKRNLRLFVHRRQKLLQYLRRSDRGGPRWQNCISSLGLTEGTWKGEIDLPR